MLVEAGIGEGDEALRDPSLKRCDELFRDVRRVRAHKVCRTWYAAFLEHTKARGATEEGDATEEAAVLGLLVDKFQRGRQTLRDDRGC